MHYHKLFTLNIAEFFVSSDWENFHFWHISILYSREQKHVLLFRKSEIWLFKVSITNMPHVFFRYKTFLFFKIENWNFQNQFEKEFCETSQSFNSIRQPIEKMKITIVWISWMSGNFVRFHEIQFQTEPESFSILSWKTKKFYS